MKKCKCEKCDCPNQITEFGHRYEEENAIVEAEFQKNPEKAESIIKEICEFCEKGQHEGNPLE
ncbi:hypothetical protein NsoK4_07710 [Nitrosopumilus sp. K4]|uniref:hypothetical protein n=1 Tax=Nitrosopumilus sp. K4 TaxID=2795383 RepID=UPI001BAA7A31|nr:hypothetical protein [Nitrosopumilus sp. K4]QUC64307.1 hypothetical protein NsoK4_07710 [Nitrosopumilus sp. K4]